MKRVACSARASLLLIAAAVVPAAAANVCEDGKAAMVRGEYNRAAQLLETCVQQNQQSADAHYWLADAYGFQARNAPMFAAMSLAPKVRSELEVAVRLAPNHVLARFALMEYYLVAPAIAGGDEKKGIEEANVIRKLDALEGHLAFSSVYSHQKKADLARNELLAAVREFPKSPMAHVRYAANLLATNDYRAALFELDTAIHLDPNYMPAYFRVGQASAISGAILPRGEESLRKYIASTSLDPNDPPLFRAHYCLGLILEKEGRKAEARKEIAESLKINENQKDAREALKRLTAGAQASRLQPPGIPPGGTACSGGSIGSGGTWSTVCPLTVQAGSLCDTERVAQASCLCPWAAQAGSLCHTGAGTAAYCFCPWTVQAEASAIRSV